MRFIKLRKDEFVLDEKSIKITKEKEQLIKELDFRHFNTGRFA